MDYLRHLAARTRRLPPTQQPPEAGSDDDDEPVLSIMGLGRKRSRSPSREAPDSPGRDSQPDGSSNKGRSNRSIFEDNDDDGIILSTAAPRGSLSLLWSATTTAVGSLLRSSQTDPPQLRSPTQGPSQPFYDTVSPILDGTPPQRAPSCNAADASEKSNASTIAFVDRDASTIAFREVPDVALSLFADDDDDPLPPPPPTSVVGARKSDATARRSGVRGGARNSRKALLQPKPAWVFDTESELAWLSSARTFLFESLPDDVKNNVFDDSVTFNSKRTATLAMDDDTASEVSDEFSIKIGVDLYKRISHGFARFKADNHEEGMGLVADVVETLLMTPIRRIQNTLLTTYLPFTIDALCVKHAALRARYPSGGKKPFRLRLQVPVRIPEAMCAAFERAMQLDDILDVIVAPCEDTFSGVSDVQQRHFVRTAEVATQERVLERVARAIRHEIDATTPDRSHSVRKSTPRPRYIPTTNAPYPPNVMDSMEGLFTLLCELLTILVDHHPNPRVVGSQIKEERVVGLLCQALVATSSPRIRRLASSCLRKLVSQPTGDTSLVRMLSFQITSHDAVWHYLLEGLHCGDWCVEGELIDMLEVVVGEDTPELVEVLTERAHTDLPPSDDIHPRLQILIHVCVAVCERFECSSILRFAELLCQVKALNAAIRGGGWDAMLRFHRSILAAVIARIQAVWDFLSGGSLSGWPSTNRSLDDIPCTPIRGRNHAGVVPAALDERWFSRRAVTQMLVPLLHYVRTALQCGNPLFEGWMLAKLIRLCSDIVRSQWCGGRNNMVRASLCDTLGALYTGTSVD